MRSSHKKRSSEWSPLAERDARKPYHVRSAELAAIAGISAGYGPRPQLVQKSASDLIELESVFRSSICGVTKENRVTHRHRT